MDGRVIKLRNETVKWVIPPYQRGYRWTREQVRLLLRDLMEFAASEEKSYCLQPLVLQMAGDGIFKVIDGQQRLTTMMMLMRELEIEPSWEFFQETGDAGEAAPIVFDGVNERDVNSVMRNLATQEISTFLNENPEARETLRGLLSEDGEKEVFFILYELSNNESAELVFRNLNAARIPLTESELLRALFMLRITNEDAKMEIAAEWELMENTFHNDEFWSMFNVKQSYQTRIDLLFGVAGVLYKEHETTGEEDITATWQEVLRCYHWMQSCYRDVRFFNLIGWVTRFDARDADVRSLYAKLKEDNHREQLSKLLQMVRNCGDYDESTLGWVRFDNGADKKLLVLLNTLQCTAEGKRFDFVRFDKQNWDIEHIAPQTENSAENPIDSRDRNNWETIVSSILSEQDRAQFEQQRTFKEKWEFVQSLARTEAHQDNAVSDRDGLGNLCLLDRRINRSYKNALFAVKRKINLDSMDGRNAVFMPPCTVMAFTKTCTPSATPIDRWTQTDAGKYLERMKDLWMWGLFTEPANDDWA